MNAVTLNDKIDNLAKRKSREHLEKMWKAINQAAANTNHLPRGHSTAWFLESFRIVLNKWLVSNKHNETYIPTLESQELENYFKEQILDEILTKIPLIKELNELQD